MSNDWFTVEKIDDTTFAISEYEHWEEVHSYLLIGEKSAILIDTGLGISNIKSVVSTLTKLPVQVVTTHVHWDHIGGNSEFKNHYVHELDEPWLRNGIPIPLEFIKSNVIKDVKDLPSEFNIDEYTVYTSNTHDVVVDEQRFDLGGRIVEVIHTPGHSPGHICLYDIERKYLFTGDLVYKGTLYVNYPSTDPKAFRDSIRRIKALDVEKVLPSHHDMNISLTLIKEIDTAFNYIEKEVGLTHGGGVFKFEGFEISI